MRKIKNVVIKQATQEDVRHFYPEGAPSTSYLWVIFYKGEAAALGGLEVRRGGCIVISEIKPHIKAPKLTIWRVSIDVLARIVALGYPIYAGCAKCDKKAQAYVERLGFKHERTFQGVELYKL